VTALLRSLHSLHTSASWGESELLGRSGVGARSNGPERRDDGDLTEYAAPFDADFGGLAQKLRNFVSTELSQAASCLGTDTVAEPRELL